MEPGEEPGEGVLRELAEETGVSSVGAARRFGRWTRLAGAGPYEDGDMQRHDWELFVIRAVDRLPARWTHLASGSAAEDALEFRCRWLPVDHNLAGQLHPLFAAVALQLLGELGLHLPEDEYAERQRGERHADEVERVEERGEA